MSAIILPLDQTRRTRPLVSVPPESIENRREAFFKVAAREIDYHFKDKNTGLNKHYALVRARRVIEEGGSVGAALQYALGSRWPQ